MSSKTPPKNRAGNDQPAGIHESEDSDGCDIVIDLDVESVRVDGIQGLSKGDRLDLQVQQAGDYASVVCVRADGIIVGAIGNFPKHSALLNCLNRGVPYVVNVTEIRPGGCHVFGKRADR